MLRLFGYLFGIGTVLLLVGAAMVFLYAKDLEAELPDYEVLSRYEPPVTTRIHAADGGLMAEYARERRLYLPIQAIPDLLKQAFISAEDKNFYRHGGVDFLALGNAAFAYGEAKLSGRDARARGASTITQQVAKNFLLTSDRTADRKIKEAMLAFRIEEAYSKEKILELYLNEIFFGLGSYGVAGASLAYFDKSVGDLDVHEVAYLASLPKAPNNYHPFRHTDRAIERRNWVIGRMAINGYITDAQASEAQAKTLGVRTERKNTFVASGEYFSEEVRREIIDRYGNDALYEGGLSIRTTLEPDMQAKAKAALSRGLLTYDRKRGYHGAFDTLTPEEIADDWGKALIEKKALRDRPEWTQAVVLDVNESTARIGIRPERLINQGISDERAEGSIIFEDAQWARKLTNREGGKRTSGKAETFADVLKPGDVIHVSNKDGRWVLEQVPEVGGALVAMDPHTGRVLALAGGFSFYDSQFNRATQANRQPGSSFKPFVYAAALDNGYTPSSVVLDGPFKKDQGGTLGVWEPKNYGGKYAGPSTLRRGIEKSRNLMTVRLANDMGMPLISEYAKRFGIYDKDIRGLASSLGSRETTVLKMVTAYSVLANGGKSIKPSLIDRIQDRYGKTIYRHEERTCEACQAEKWDGQAEPALIDNRDQVLDPMTAYQITSMMEGVVQRGTATSVAALGVPIAGKTGTTNDEKDAWFVGYSPDMVVGVFVGYDRPEPMGKGNTGGGLAAPIFTEFMQASMSPTAAIDFRVPNGIKLFPINAKTGLLARPGQPGVIMEAFKPGTKPPSKQTVIGFKSEMLRGQLRVNKEAQEAVQQGTGGLF
ncbi:penicillin-binding protein 1A [Ahrensia sp. R2A130]|uniref:penicillin-binding protein 1A n=1 Tax=Ahrensia sp. R2A130 TaxID=744979 RepID=UPI00058D5F2C|nr:penicillin-binding protein 1A [Ahrensia sp. R2A130]